MIPEIRGSQAATPYCAPKSKVIDAKLVLDTLAMLYMVENKRFYFSSAEHKYKMARLHPSVASILEKIPIFEAPILYLPELTNQASRYREEKEAELLKEHPQLDPQNPATVLDAAVNFIETDPARAELILELFASPMLQAPLKTQEEVQNLCRFASIYHALGRDKHAMEVMQHLGEVAQAVIPIRDEMLSITIENLCKRGCTGEVFFSAVAQVKKPKLPLFRAYIKSSNGDACLERLEQVKAYLPKIPNNFQIKIYLASHYFRYKDREAVRELITDFSSSPSGGCFSVYNDLFGREENRKALLKFVRIISKGPLFSIREIIEITEVIQCDYLKSQAYCLILVHHEKITPIYLCGLLDWFFNEASTEERYGELLPYLNKFSPLFIDKIVHRLSKMDHTEKRIAAYASLAKYHIRHKNLEKVAEMIVFMKKVRYRANPEWGKWEDSRGCCDRYLGKVIHEIFLKHALFSEGALLNYLSFLAYENMQAQAITIYLRDYQNKSAAGIEFVRVRLSMLSDSDYKKEASAALKERVL